VYDEIAGDLISRVDELQEIISLSHLAHVVSSPGEDDLQQNLLFRSSSVLMPLNKPIMMGQGLDLNTSLPQGESLNLTIITDRDEQTDRTLIEN